MISTDAPVPSHQAGPLPDQLRLAVTAYLARFKGSSREHTESDLPCYLTWCAERTLDPLTVQRPHLELYVRWMQEARQFKPSTISRRFSSMSGLASWLGNVPSIWKHKRVVLHGSRSKSFGATRPPIPLPASRTTLNGLMTAGSMNDMT